MSTERINKINLGHKMQCLRSTGLAARNLYNMIGASMSVCGLNGHTVPIDIMSICPSVHPDTA